MERNEFSAAVQERAKEISRARGFSSRTTTSTKPPAKPTSCSTVYDIGLKSRRTRCPPTPATTLPVRNSNVVPAIASTPWLLDQRHSVDVWMDAAFAVMTGDYREPERKGKPRSTSTTTPTSRHSNARSSPSTSPTAPTSNAARRRPEHRPQDHPSRVRSSAPRELEVRARTHQRAVQQLQVLREARAHLRQL